MFDFLLQKPVVGGAQRSIDKLDPKVNVHIPADLPLPSVNLIKKMCVIVSKINALEPQLQQASDDELKAKTNEFKKKFDEAVKTSREKISQLEDQLKKAHSSNEREDITTQITTAKEEYKTVKSKVLDEILPEAFGVVREVAKRVVAMRPYDIQLVGGMVLHQGSIAEMTTGEGKTLVGTLPAYLNGLSGDGVHIVTVNDYLAKRDREWMGPVFEFLGLTVGVIQHDMDHEQRQIAYNCDITYGTNNEFGFDYLRDNMVNFKEEMVQRQHNYAIVDEVDSILVDEARTPLIISGPAEESTDKYYKANEIAKKLKGRKTTGDEIIDAKYKEIDLTKGYDFVGDEKARSISLTEEGEEKAARMFGVDNLHDMETIEYRHHILQALKAHTFFRHDVDYVIRDGQVIIVDEFTGRMMPGRRWSDGLHQAVEAKEGIKIERENQTLATITFQNYFRMYDKLAGMTGTAHTEAAEFEQIYKLDCIVMPTNRKLRRNNHPDCIYKTTKEKFAAVVEEIKEKYDRGQPVLVGTISIENSELLSSLLKQQGIDHRVLNAKYHELEAQIVAQAGRYKAITIATNMAGRGTDIVLGGNPEFLAKNLVEQKSKESEDKIEKEELTQKFLKQFQEQCKEEHKKVVEAGGLFVLGTERHESRRIDNQLRGRSGRQGDPGESRFYVALEDDLMRLFGGDRIGTMMDKFGMEEGQVIEHPWVSKSLEIAQKRVETHNFEIRKQLLEYDNVMNKQREVIYNLRRSILESESVKDRILEAIEDTVDLRVKQHLFSPKEGEVEEYTWDVEGLDLYIKTKFNSNLGINNENLKDKPQERIVEAIMQGLLAHYEHKEKEVSVEHMRHMEKFLLMHTIDAKWKDHLYEMDRLKEGVGWRSYAQRDPIVEYKREGLDMFWMMFDSISQEVAETIYKIQPVERNIRMKSVFDSLPQQMVHNDYSSLSEQARQSAANHPGEGPPAPEDGGPAMEQPPAPKPIQKSGPKIGRNDPCPCGSGKKYKKCCGR